MRKRGQSLGLSSGASALRSPCLLPPTYAPSFVLANLRLHLATAGRNRRVKVHAELNEDARAAFRPQLWSPVTL